MEQPHENCPCMETCPLNRAMALIGTVATNVYIYLTPVITLVASALILPGPPGMPSIPVSAASPPSHPAR